MKKAKDVFKKIAFGIFAVLLYMVFIADRILTAPFPIEQPKPENWKLDKIKYSIIRVCVVALFAWLFWFNWLVAVIILAILIVALVVLSIIDSRKQKEQPKENVYVPKGKQRTR
jgi:ABC-type multidrug transport system fused ATPase/permease subunit